jgi:hypothetical protein
MPRPLLFKEQLIYEQLASQSVHGLRENLTCVWSRQPLKIEQWRHPFRCVRKPPGTCQIPVIMGILSNLPVQARLGTARETASLASQ